MVSLASQLTLNSDRDVVDSDYPGSPIYHPSHSRDPLANIPMCIKPPHKRIRRVKDNADENEKRKRIEKHVRRTQYKRKIEKKLIYQGKRTIMEYSIATMT